MLGALRGDRFSADLGQPLAGAEARIEDRESQQRAGPQNRWLLDGGEHFLQPSAAFGEVAPHQPVSPERDRKAQCHRWLAC